MPDPEKFAALERMGFCAAKCCGTCTHFRGKPGEWGRCGSKTYDHAKHGETILGVPSYGTCNEHQADHARIEKVFGSYAKIALGDG